MSVTEGVMVDTHFIEVDQSEIMENFPSYFHEQARYFKAIRKGKTLCFYGIINRADEQTRLDQTRLGVCEAFLMIQTFNGKVLSKGFFAALFAHAFSLGYKEVWTWTKWKRLIKLFVRFERFGIEQTDYPSWDLDSTKVWFLKRI